MRYWLGLIAIQLAVVACSMFWDAWPWNSFWGFAYFFTFILTLPISFMTIAATASMRPFKYGLPAVFIVPTSAYLLVIVNRFVGADGFAVYLYGLLGCALGAYISIAIVGKRLDPVKTHAKK